MLKNRGGITFYEKDEPQEENRIEIDYSEPFNKYAWLLAIAGLIVFILLSSLCVHGLGTAICSNPNW